MNNAQPPDPPFGTTQHPDKVPARTSPFSFTVCRPVLPEPLYLYSPPFQVQSRSDGCQLSTCALWSPHHSRGGASCDVSIDAWPSSLRDEDCLPAWPQRSRPTTGLELLRFPGHFGATNGAQSGRIRGPISALSGLERQYLYLRLGEAQQQRQRLLSNGGLLGRILIQDSHCVCVCVCESGLSATNKAAGNLKRAQSWLLLAPNCLPYQ